MIKSEPQKSSPKTFVSQLSLPETRRSVVSRLPSAGQTASLLFKLLLVLRVFVLTMALVKSAASTASFICGGCGSLNHAARGQGSVTKHSQSHLPNLSRRVIIADARSSQNGAEELSEFRTRGARRYTPRASPVLEELRLMADAAAAADAEKKGDWLSGLIKKLPRKQNAKQARKIVTGLEV
jgi:hypothetical protein